MRKGKLLSKIERVIDEEIPESQTRTGDSTVVCSSSDKYGHRNFHELFFTVIEKSGIPFLRITGLDYNGNINTESIPCQDIVGVEMGKKTWNNNNR